MAFGRHWEWRGFGVLDEPIRESIESLPPAYATSPEGARFSDRYLWIPGCKINVKVRTGLESGLKFKRLLQEKDGLELWEERPDELYSLPLEPAIVVKLARELGVVLREPPTTEIPDEATLLAILEQATPRVVDLRVEKLRRTFQMLCPAGDREIPVLVEVAQITAPEEILSVGLEEASHLGEDAEPAAIHDARAAVANGYRELGLPGHLVPMNYLQALAKWARGEKIATAK